MTNFIYKYDTLFIFVAAIVNIIIFILASKNLKDGRKMIHPEANKRFGVSVNLGISKDDANILQKKRNIIVVLYSAYANMTAIFPLLGILGTVASLVMYSKEADLMDNLMVALKTTLYGVFFAILFKIFDSLLSGTIDSFVDDADYLIRHYDAGGENVDEA